MGDEQQRGVAAAPAAKLGVVERGDDGLAGPGRGDDEVRVAALALALDRERVEHSLLVRVGADIEVGERDRRRLTERAAVVLPQRSREVVAVDGGVVSLEMLGVPVALERRLDAADQVRGVN